MLYDPNINPIIGNPQDLTVQYRQTRETLLDVEEYMRFIYSVENQFRRSRFYKDYKCSVMNRGLFFDQQMKAITSDMADIELHHHLPTLKDAAITITESILQETGSVNTFDVINTLIECHRSNMMGIIMLSSTNHQMYESGVGAFISISQLYGNPFAFIDKYAKYFSLDMSFRILLQFKQEEQYGNVTHWPMIARARDQLLSFVDRVPIAW